MRWISLDFFSLANGYAFFDKYGKYLVTNYGQDYNLSD